ncbi:hypothetical protein Dimus_035448 [Dionaea muscipula]
MAISGVKGFSEPPMHRIVNVLLRGGRGLCSSSQIVSVPSSIMETHELSGMTLKYRRECGRDNVLQSLANVVTGASSFDGLLDSGNVECQHLLRLMMGPRS